MVGGKYAKRSNVKFAKKITRAKRSAKAKVPMSIRSYVNKTVNRNLETKMVTVQSGFTGYNSSINSAGDNITLLPQLLVGTDQNNRIGQNIKPIKLVIRGYITYRTDAFQPAQVLGVRHFVYSDRSVSNYTMSTAAGSNFNLLDLGGTALIFDGTLIRYTLPTNKEGFKFYHDKRHIMNKPFGYTDTLSTTSSNSITGFDNSMFIPFTITLTQKDLPATFKYDPQLSSAYPTNFAPFMALGYCNILGYGPDTLNPQIAMTFNSTLYYKDA